MVLELPAVFLLLASYGSLKLLCQVHECLTMSPHARQRIAVVEMLLRNGEAILQSRDTLKQYLHQTLFQMIQLLSVALQSVTRVLQSGGQILQRHVPMLSTLMHAAEELSLEFSQAPQNFILIGADQLGCG